jgi:hypothetical protein
MGFLDDIGQRGSESRPKDSRPSVPQTLIRDDPPRAVQITPIWTPPKTDRIHPAAIWCAVLFVVGAVATAAWLGMRDSAFFASPNLESTTDAPPEETTPVDTPTTKPTSVRPQTAGRRAGAATVTDRGEAVDETESDTSVPVAPVSQPGDVTEAAGTPLEAVPDPIAAASIAPLVEDDHVYSSEGAGVVAPRLTSLGFVRRLISGLRVRTSRIELIVSKSGTVERAKIFSTEVHWEDALLLSRAKTFQFVPAYRNGFPVRYRYVLNVDTSP